MTQYAPRTERFEYASELFDAIRLSNESWRDYDEIPKIHRPFWLFRGQADTQWDLVPSRFRDDLKSVFSSVGPEDIRAQSFEVRRRECREVEQFLYLVDREGMLPAEFDLPSGSWRHSIHDRIPDEALRGYGLAQHHGIRTRLLDWTSNPLAALFFAAESALELDRARSATEQTAGERREFVVWAIHRASIGGAVRVVRPRVTSNEFLRRQSGWFTLAEDTMLAAWNADGTACSHNELIGEHLGSATVESSGYYFRKLTAPWSLAKDVLEMLEHEGVDRMSLMPTFDNAARSAELEIFLSEEELA